MISNNPLVLQKGMLSFPFVGAHYGVNEMVAMLYKASHKKGNESEKQWLQQMKLYLERVSCCQSGNSPCKTVETYLKNSLHNFIKAADRFETLYTSNCPMAGVFPSPMIRGLNRMTQQAKLALLYIEI